MYSVVTNRTPAIPTSLLPESTSATLLVKIPYTYISHTTSSTDSVSHLYRSNGLVRKPYSSHEGLVTDELVPLN